MLAPYCSFIRPTWLRRTLLRLIPDRDVHRLKDVAITMHESSEGIYHARKQAFLRDDESVNTADGKDVMSILRAYQSCVCLGVIRVQ